MRILKMGMCAVACALAVIHFRAPLAAQALTITSADRATYQTFLETCSTQLAGMKKALAAANQQMSDAELRAFIEPMPAQLREQAREENVTFAVGLREARARFTKELNDPNNRDEGQKILGPMALCFFDVIERGASGPAAGAPGGPATPPAPTAPPDGPRTTDPSVPPNCLDIDPAGGFKNNCDMPLYFNACAYRPQEGSFASAFDCEKQQFALDGIGARGVQGWFTKAAERVYWYYCPKPATPVGARFSAAQGIVATCK